MSHPFELELSDLEVIELGIEEQLTDEKAETIQGGTVTNYLTVKGGSEAGEEGGGFPIDFPPIDFPCIPPTTPIINPPAVTTHYVTAEIGEAGEEGGTLF